MLTSQRLVRGLVVIISASLIAPDAVTDFFLLAVPLVLADSAFFLAAIPFILTLVRTPTLVAPLLTIVVVGQLHKPGGIRDSASGVIQSES